MVAIISFFNYELIYNWCFLNLAYEGQKQIREDSVASDFSGESFENQHLKSGIWISTANTSEEIHNYLAYQTSVRRF